MAAGRGLSAILLLLGTLPLPALAQLGPVPGLPASTLGMPNGPLQLTPAGSVRVNLLNGAFSPIEYRNHAGLAGTTTASTYDGLAYPTGFVFDMTRIAADQLTADTSMSNRTAVIGQEVQHLFGGGNATGSRIAQGAFATMQAAMAANDSPNSYFGAHYGYARALVNDGGTAPTTDSAGTVTRHPKGNLFGYNPQVQLAPGATWWGGIQAMEADTEVDAGASVDYKFGINSTTIGNDAVHAAVREAAFHVGAVPSTGGWAMGLMFSDLSGGGVPVASTGTLIGSAGSVGTVASGIDFSAFAFTGPVFNAPGIIIGSDPANMNIGLGKATGTPYLDFNGTSRTRLIGDAAGKLTVASQSGGGIAAFQASPGGNSMFVNGSATVAGVLTANTLVATASRTPASSSEACTAGQQSWDSNYEYRCVAANTWKRVALSSW